MEGDRPGVHLEGRYGAGRRPRTPGFKDVTEAAGLGRDWTPRELRHTFVSVLSASGMPIEQVALLAGHSVTSTTETVYRRQITEAAMPGAEILGEVLRPLRRVRKRHSHRPRDG